MTIASQINDDITDNGTILLDDFYSETGYPWEDNYKAYDPISAVAMDGCQIRKAFNTYPLEGCYLRFAIRFAEILGHAVPNEAYIKLAAMRNE